MDAFHRLAGVTETTEPIVQPSLPTVSDSQTVERTSTLPRDSHPAQGRPSLQSKRTATADSLDRRRSTQAGRTFDPNSTANDLPKSDELPLDGQPLEDEGDGDFAWNPSHPCFPHPNPHCLPDTPEYDATRVIRVQRDWLASADLYPQYANLYPEILDPMLTEDEFRALIAGVNEHIAAALSPTGIWAVVDAVLGALTGWLWEDFGLTHAKRGITKLEAYVDEFNVEMNRTGRDVRLVQPRITGFMALDFVVPDPGLLDGEEQEQIETEEQRQY